MISDEKSRKNSTQIKLDPSAVNNTGKNVRF